MNKQPTWGIRKIYLVSTLLIFLVSSFLVVGLVAKSLMDNALKEAEEKALIIVNRNLAIHEYFTAELKPPLMELLDDKIQKGYFDHKWMSSTYAVRQINKYASDGKNVQYYYKEAVINARSPQNEADGYEKKFIKQLNENPTLKKKKGVRIINGETFFYVMHKSEIMQTACFRCHSTPAAAPKGLLQAYGSKRGFGGRHEGEVISVMSVRVPMSTIISSGRRSFLYLCLLLIGVSAFSVLVMVVITNRTLINPIKNIEKRVKRIYENEAILNEEIPLEGGREFRGLISSVNAMGKELRNKNKQMEEEVRARTQDLSLANDNLIRENTERKKTEEAMRASETRYRRLFESAKDGFLILDAETGMVVDVNPFLIELLGYSHEAFTEKAIWELGFFKDIVGNKDKFDELRNKEYVRYENMPLETVDGRRIEVEFVSNVYLVNDCKVIQCNIRDITARKKAEAAIKESDKQFRTIFDSSNDAIFMHEPYGAFLEVNQSASERYGYSREEFLKMSAMDLDSTEQATQIPQRTERIVEDGKALFETVHRNKNGEIIHVEINSRSILYKGKTAILSNVRDITERKKMEVCIEDEKRRKEMYFNLAEVGLAVLGDDENIHLINNKGHRILGYEEHELNDNNWFDVLVPERIREEVRGVFHKLMAGEIEPVKYFENELIKKSGEARMISFHNAVIRDIHDNITGILFSFDDITERKTAEKMQQKLREQEKHAAVGKVAGKMAHDFNNVLAVIMGTSQLLQSEGLPQEIKADIDTILESAERGVALTKNLLLFAKDQEPKLSQFDINEKIELVIRALKPELKDIQVNLTYGSSMEKLLADAGLLENAMINMIQNSIHAMSKTEKPELNIKTYSENDNICIEIKDNGCGIPAECLKKIFEPTFTLKGSGDRTGAYKQGITGSGYGMANVKQCIDKHGGTIGVESEAGKGAKFKITLPLIKGYFSKEEMKRIREHKIVKGKRILIVEDEIHLGRILHSALQKFEHKIDLATDGKMALDHIERNVYDVVSMDYMLPDTNGLELYRKIRETNKKVPIIFVSGSFEFMQSMIDFKKEDAKVDHLAKPFNNVDYVNKIHEWLEE